METTTEAKEEDVMDMVSPIGLREVTTSAAVIRQRTRMETRMGIATQVEHAADAEEIATTKLEDDEDEVEVTEVTATADETSATPRSTAGTNAPFGSRTR